jgi:hypothetical protein
LAQYYLAVSVCGSFPNLIGNPISSSLLPPPSPSRFHSHILATLLSGILTFVLVAGLKAIFRLGFDRRSFLAPGRKIEEPVFLVSMVASYG